MARKPAPKPSMAQKAKDAFTSLSRALDPVERFRPAAKRAMDRQRNNPDSMIAPKPNDRKRDKKINDETSSRKRRDNGRRNA